MMMMMLVLAFSWQSGPLNPVGHEQLQGQKNRATRMRTRCHPGLQQH
jgi:hypothetical protein